MNDDDQIPYEALQIISFLMKYLKESMKWLALCTAVLGFYIASPLSKRDVDLIPLNPMFVVDAKRFGGNIVGEVYAGNVSTTVVTELNKILNAKLGETGDKFIYFLERSQTIKSSVRHVDAVPVSGEELSLRFGLQQSKLNLGYDDKDTRGDWGRIIAP